MKQSQTSVSISPWLKPALLAVVAAIVTAGCKTQAITPPGGAGLPMPPSSGGMPAPSGGSSGSSGGSSGSSGGSSGSSGGSSGSSGGSSGSSGGSSGSSGGSSGSSGGSTGGGEGSSGNVGSMPQIEMPGGFPGADGGGDGDGDADADGDGDGDGDGNSDCGDTGELPGGVGGMGQAGECLGGGASSASDSDSEAASDSGSDGGGPDGGGTAGTGGAGGVGQFPAESNAERAERLGRELEESVGGFDEVLLEEQREIAAVGRSTEGFGGGSGGGSGGISLGEQSAGGSSGGSVSIANPTGPTRKSPIAGMSDQEIRERTPDDIPVTVDDDIISRQLREAALAEEDPELRERLWEEYRKYKNL